MEARIAVDCGGTESMVCTDDNAIISVDTGGTASLNGIGKMIDSNMATPDPHRHKIIIHFFIVISLSQLSNKDGENPRLCYSF